MIRRDFNLVISRWRSLPTNQSVITVEKINPMSAIQLIFEVWQAVMEEYQPTLQICFSVSQLGGALSFYFSLVNLRKDGSLFHIAVILDGLGFLRREIIFYSDFHFRRSENSIIDI